MNSIESHFSDFSAACRANNAHQAMLANAMVSFSIQHNRDLGKEDDNEHILSQMENIKKQELIIACARGNIATVDYLLEIGVDAAIYGEAPLLQAAEFGHIDVATSLIAWGAKPACAEFVLSDPVINGDLDMVVFLMKHGAEIGGSAFSLAIRYNQDKIINYFINQSLKFGLGLNTRPEYLEYIGTAKNSKLEN